MCCRDGLTALHCAASRGHTECIDTLISLCGAPTDLIDSNGCTALHYAVTLGHADATSRLLDLDADPNRQDRKGRTPAHCGCAKGQFETVKLLKERGANLWLRNAKGDLPVHEAASSGRRELVEWLLEQRPKQVNTTSNDGRSLLHIAAGNDYADMCKMLLDYGADINSIYRNSKGIVMTPLDCALQKGYRSIAKFLQSNGGLPATKLRLSGLRPNAFNDQELVKPLKHIEKEEIYDLKNSMRITKVNARKSDSESADCSCNENNHRKQHSTHHACNHHIKRFRRRTSSCGEVEDIQKDDESNDVHRSKSNIEIRRRKSREKIYTSGEDDDSCENCCKHKRRLKLRRKDRPTRRSREWIESDVEIEEKYIRKERKRSKNDVQEESEEIAEKVIRRKVDQDRTSKQISEYRRRPQSAKRRQQKSLFTKPSEGAMTIDLTDEDEIPKSEKVITEVEIHKTDEAVKEEVSQKESERQVIKETEKEVVDEASKKPEKELENTDKIVENLTIPQITEQTVSEQDKSAEIRSDIITNEKKEEESGKVEEQLEDEEIKHENKLEEKAEEKAEGKTGEKVEEKVEEEVEKTTKDVKEDKSIEKIESKKELELETVPSKEDKKPNEQFLASTSAEITAKDQDKILDNAQEKEVKAELNATGKIEEACSIIPDKPTETETKESKMDEVQVETSEIDREQEGRRSFTLLLESPNEEDNKSVRKGSFTVLKSDESVDVEEALEKLDKEKEQSFKVVPNNKSKLDSDVDYSTTDEAIEECDDDDDDQILLRQRISSGSRFIQTSPSLEGRKRRLKKRMKNDEKQKNLWRSESVQQQQTSKDQDSGFEPSPRAMKTKIPTPRGIHTAYLPRKPIYATLDKRSCSSRVEGRKPGDRGACSMSAVTRSIQRNIRR